MLQTNLPTGIKLLYPGKFSKFPICSCSTALLIVFIYVSSMCLYYPVTSFYALAVNTALAVFSVPKFQSCGF